MPTILLIGPYRCFFYSADGVEPPHIHVERDAGLAKYWLGPVRLARSRGFTAQELRALERVVREHETQLTEAWHEYFDA
jgi:Domain of unknown function (DUF4160)